MKKTTTKFALSIAAALCISSLTVDAQTVDTAKTAHIGSCNISISGQQGVRADYTESFCNIGSVPAGKRWVVEHATIKCKFHAYPGTTPPPVMWSRLGVAINNGNLQDLSVFPLMDEKQSTGVDGSGLPTRIYQASISGRFYTDIWPTITFDRYPGILSDIGCYVSASGYLIDK